MSRELLEAGCINVQGVARSRMYKCYSLAIMENNIHVLWFLKGLS
jgi:hypothetical protein